MEGVKQNQSKEDVHQGDKKLIKMAPYDEMKMKYEDPTTSS
jgi:hypothetical protein